MSTCRHFNSDCTVDYIKKICILTVLSKVTMAEHEGKCGHGVSAKLARGGLCAGLRRQPIARSQRRSPVVGAIEASGPYLARKSF